MSNEIAKLKETLEALEDALASGVLTVVVDGETTTFDSEQGLRRRVNYFQRKLDILRSANGRKPAFGSVRLRGCGG